MRGGAVWQLVGLITRRSQVRILPPLPSNRKLVVSITGVREKGPSRGLFDETGPALVVPVTNGMVDELNRSHLP